jgi:hypothetical protein
MTLTRTRLAFAICASLIGVGSAQALPAASSSALVITQSSTTSLIEEARYRGGYGYNRGYNRGYYGGYRRNRGAAIGLGIAGAIIGSAIIANEGSRYRRYEGQSGSERCANTYRSYDSDTGTYMGYDGVRRQCPYLD